MDPQKSSELRVRLRRVKSGTGKLRTGITAAPSTSKSPALATESSESEDDDFATVHLATESSESEDDDFATVHFKLAAALEAAAAHASGLNFDWCTSKTTATTSAVTGETVDSVTNAPVAPKLGQTESLQLQPNMQEPTHQEERQHLEDDEEPELVELVIASPYSSSCSSEDEGVAELHNASASDTFLTTVVPTKNTSDNNILHSPLSPVVNDCSTNLSSAIMNNTLRDEVAASIDCSDENQTAAVTNILALPPFDPYAPQLKVQLIIKQIVSLAQLKQRIVDSSKGAISKKGPMSECERLAEMEFANIHVKHSLEEFFTFCSCKNCLEYREIVVHLMVDQFKAQHMVVMLVDALIKAYSPMLKNATAHSKFEKLLDANKEIYWMTCGYIYNKMAEHMYFIYDESLSDNMILVLFSAILLVNNPLLLLQILSFHVVCIVKAYAEGFLEIVDPDNNKIPAEEMLKYILDGYDDLCRISEHISCYLFAFENDFLRKFSLTWTMLCQRLYQQHVYLNLTDTMLACIITLKEDELTARHAALIKKYIQFDDKMIYVDKRWTDIWMELNKFNLSEVERKRRTCLLDVHRIFETVVQDAIELSLRESSDDNDFYDFQTLENRQLAWQNIMAYMKMKWPDGFFDSPNVLVCEDTCKSCKVLLEYHADSCKCITCSIAGGPLPPKRNPDNTCYKCLALLLVEKEVTFYESKILNVCASDDFLSFIKNNEKRKSSTLEELGVEVCSTVGADDNLVEGDQQESSGTYHLAWAVFRHLNNRKRFKNSTIEAKYFCSDCEFQACRLARKILNNEIALALSLHLIRYYQPLSMSREELRSILPNIMLYNRKMVSSNIGLDLNDVHDLVVKIYWTFVISVYATYFIEFDNDCPLHLENFELINNDIKLQTSNLTGNKDDTKFVLFLDKIKGLSCDKDELESEMENSEDGHVDEIQKKLEEFLKITENAHSQPLLEQTPSPESDKPSAALSTDSSNKKNCKDKSKKCCFDHSDLGDHCKENHSNKKRIKKECNHARMNETRDRLRKKLSQLVNARKNMKATVEKQSGQQTANKVNQPPTLKTAATAAASTSSSILKEDGDDDSLECLNTLCKRISHLNTGKPGATEAVPLNPMKKANLNAPLTGKKIVTNNITKETFSNKTLNCNAQVQACDKFASDYTNASSSSAGIIPKANGSGLDMVNEIYELLGTYSKDQTKVKKWINETLSFIEGSNGNSSGKQQPQPTSAKKAAKKAKQKQRKEEEKRIIELQDLRAQFHVIYFKEFVDKHDLKELKSSKKRDKKRISELEANVKKLQRAKAKVETAILELIATVKQSNIEFKFTYLPTKEQQLEKIKQLKSGDITHADGCSLNLPTTATTATPTISTTSDHIQPQQFMISSLQTTTNDNLNTTNIATGSYSLPYAHANNFPYHHIDLQAPGVAPTPTSFGMIRPPLPTPMCYAPPQHQQLSPDVVAAMAANAACNSVNDPSKRIVTIRRVNLPNVPEPQVTVTAKGTSPDKDKLLYTFVNGQLLQNGATMAPITQMPGKPMQVQSAHVPSASQHLISLPTPPLSKTQLKKERRRLALKAAEEAEAAIKAKHQKLLEEELELQKQIEAEAAAAAKTAKIKFKVKINEKQLIESVEKLASIKSKKKKKSKPTSDATELIASASSTTSTQRRSSSATSFSAAIQSSSVSLSSQENTRDNSKCRQAPTAKQPKLKTLQQTQILKQAKKDKQNPKKTLTPTPTPTATQKLEPPPPPFEKETISIVKKKKSKRHKFIDNGQFDNNPFKSLHMKDFSSDSEMGLSSCEEDDEPEGCVAAVTEVKQIKDQISGQKSAKNKASKREQPKKNTAEVVEKQENKNRPQVRAPSTTEKRVQRSENNKREPSKTAQPKVEGQKPQRSNKNLAAKQQSQDQQAKQPQSQNITKKPQNELRGKSATQQRPTSQQQPPTNKRSSLGTLRYDRTSNQRSAASMQTSSSSNLPPGSSFNTHSHRNNNRNSNRNHVNNSEKQTSNKSEPPLSKPLSKRAQKQALRNKHKCQKQHNSSNFYSGIPNNMGYFNPNEFSIPSTQIKQQQSQFQQLKQCQQQQYKDIQQQMQNLHISNNNQQQLNSNFATCNNYLMSTTDSARQSSAESPNVVNTNSAAANVSIMDQLNRGVQVENLSLPPGITLTKVDPIKSEQLRKKSESIKKLAKPLQPQQHQLPQSFHHPGATIIAPPVAGYYGAPYAGVAAAATLGQSGGVIMLETMPPGGNAKNPSQVRTNVAAAAAAASNNKSSKSKKRRNKSKLVNSSRHAEVSAPHTSKANSSGQPKMVTLRNPMFHSGPPGAPAAAAIIQQPNVMPGRTVGGIPIAATLPIDQPAAIIKNENGMFTIRNPALQQAVANGMAMGNYRQFGNVNYYTPQEAVAEAARATQQNAVNASLPSAVDHATFSYFSNSSIPNQTQLNLVNVRNGGASVPPASCAASDFSRDTPHNNISISCTRVGDNGGLVGDSAVIARPVQSSKFISAIGSEIKNAQQQKQKSIEHHWTNFGPELPNSANSSDALACGTSFLSGSARSAITTSPIQDKYQHSNYYNGFVDVFPATASNSNQIPANCGRSSNTSSSLFDTTDCHMNHNCGDDSPPPTITGFNHYLEGIPNTGVIRYDDAAFLKTLMPGQNLNNEVSIHNVNDSNFTRSSTSPLPHRVEISPVYTNRSTSENIYEHGSNSSSNYRDSLNEYSNDANLFVPNSLLNLNELESSNRDVESFERFNYDFDSPKEKQKVHININDLLINKTSSVSNRTSPYMDENALDNFVQNINALQISATATTDSDEQCSQLNSGASHSGACKNAANGWW